MKNYVQIFVLLFFVGCSSGQNQPADSNKIESSETTNTEENSETVRSEISTSNVGKIESLINPKGMTVESRFKTPEGYGRFRRKNQNFQGFLQKLPLKSHGSDVKYYNGSTKPNNEVYDAVVDLEIGSKDLHQCADAIMRLRAEFLWRRGQYEDIHFNFTNGFRVDYSEWMKGRRMVINGNKTYWNNRSQHSNDYKDFWKYMELIFMYAGTLSLEKELTPVPISDIKVGDVFIQGGSPGHAVIVVDMAINNAKEKIFLLAQSYMPAQEIQVLKNPNEAISPWYSVKGKTEIETPEWTFSVEDLKRF